MNATLGMFGEQAALRMERRLAHPQEKVWRAVTEPDRLGQWFPFTVVEMDLRVGGKITFDGGGTTTDAEITELDPPRLFAFVQHAPREMPREGDNVLRFELLPEEGGCLLVFTQVFHDRPAAASYASGWQVCLDAMDAIVGGRPAEWPEGNFAHLHEAYVEAFGLAEGSAERQGERLGEQAGGGWRVRFERQLTRPVEEVWAAAGAPAATPG
ncbi:SRPBCC family protein, partial [Microbispora rosea]